MLIDFQYPRTPKIIENTLENKGFCYFALFHFGSKKSRFRTRLGPPNPPKSTPRRLPGRPSGSKMASKPALGPPRWPSRRAPRPPNRLPDRPRANFGGPRSFQAPILAAREPLCLQFQFWRSQASFWTPRSQFSIPEASIFQPKLPFAPVLHASKTPILQDERGGMRGAFE